MRPQHPSALVAIKGQRAAASLKTCGLSHHRLFMRVSPLRFLDNQPFQHTGFGFTCPEHYEFEELIDFRNEMTLCIHKTGNRGFRIHNV